ncbi:branched-chain amino acid aminotransferase [Phycicoccus duodecadis]|uniref:branched-chain-amino-acid transaminase n=1 Tax=Phycicoccus duodecadis TaxID=173053 RepID=A0A2N3YGG9_9MICO|nr:branched-chain amino acid aminotransferase [Phycicoccus duodecadis]PKW25941.1 branched-chain amino acid aminotransferase [Phycicoccus duodecadis]
MSAAAAPATTIGGLPVTVEPTTSPLTDAARAERMRDPGFGRVFSEHMLTIRWTREGGWQEARLTPYGPLALDPATSALHYGQSVFEGFKVYRGADGSVAAFRPEANAERFRASARRLCLPELPVEVFTEAVDLLVGHDHAWVPSAPGQTLYVRPLLFASEPELVVRPSEECLFVLTAFVAADYFPRGLTPVTVWVADHFVRAAPGGTGAAKCAANYAAGLAAQAEAAEQGCDQVVFLDAVERRWVEELGGMNLLFVYGGDVPRLVTPALTGTLLPGITRDSLLTLARDLGMEVEEGRVSVEDWEADARSGALTEVFACGTAAVLTPVGRVRREGAEWVVGDGDTGPVTAALRERLLAVQTGAVPDEHGWRRVVAPLG